MFQGISISSMGKERFPQSLVFTITSWSKNVPLNPFHRIGLLYSNSRRNKV